MKYLQGPNRSCLREESLIAHHLHQAHPPDLDCYGFRVLEPVRKVQCFGCQAEAAPIRRHSVTCLKAAHLVHV